MRTLIIAAAGIALVGCSQQARSSENPAGTSNEQTRSEPRTPDVIFVPTPQQAVDKMLEIAGVQKGDVVYDLGSGDGRIPISAARSHGVRAVGIDIDPQRIAESRENARTAGVEHLVTFKEADLFDSDISEASVVTLYLLSSLNEKLRPKLLSELKPGTRIVSYSFPMGDWQPEKEISVAGTAIYLWRVPAK